VASKELWATALVCLLHSKHTKSLSLLGKSWQGEERLFSVAPRDIVFVLLFCHFLLTCCLLCFPFRFFSFCVYQHFFSFWIRASNDPHLLLLFVPCMAVLCRLSCSAFSQHSSFSTSVPRVCSHVWLQFLVPWEECRERLRKRSGREGVFKKRKHHGMCSYKLALGNQNFFRILYTTLWNPEKCNFCTVYGVVGNSYKF